LNEYITNGHDSIVVEPDSIDQIASSIVKLVLDKDLSKRIGVNGRETAKMNFHYSMHADRLFQFFSKL